ncbi:MAG: hypothetical protein H6502_00765 [Candidatus Woesearchaeota archaeon]|nr:MAG: hypothetical protein H6502_00765 [Candidatus Woesearchaeota archaeon]
MKHPRTITYILIAIFVVSQLIGIFVLSAGLQEVTKSETGEIELTYQQTAIGERPELSGTGTVIWLVMGILLGTIVLLILAKYKLKSVWKGWFFLAVWITMSIALGVFMPYPAAYMIGLVLALLKVLRKQPLIHNITEVLVYSGIAFLVAPLLPVMYSIILLVIISFYDMYAVWKSKHMITLAKFTSQSQLFAGLAIPSYQEKKGKKTLSTHAKKNMLETGNVAVLGGGDVVFPLLFSGSVMNWLLLSDVSKAVAVSYTLLITVCATIALSLLFYVSKKGKFYPAMPPITAGCLVGLGIIYLLRLFF